MATFPQVTSPPQALAEVLVNEALETLEHQAVYGKNHDTTTGLTWGYYGGRWGGFAVTTGTLSLTASSTNYVVVAVATGVISVSTTATNWNNTTDYARVYKLTTSGSAVTAVEDHRSGSGGISGGAGGGAASVIPWKTPVRVASTANGTLATAFVNGATVDGVTLVTGDRILLKDQSSASENGIRVVAASGAPARAVDADAGDELVGATVFVNEGTANADKIFSMTTNAPIVVNTTSLTWTQVGGTVVPDDSITYAKLQNVTAAARLLGRGGASGSGDPQELTIGASLSLSGTELALAAAAQAEMVTGYIGTVADGDYLIVLKARHGGDIYELTTKCTSGTCTVTGKINSTPLGGTANSVSTSEQSQAHSSANDFVAGDDIVLTVSANAACIGFSFNIGYTRAY